MSPAQHEKPGKAARTLIVARMEPEEAEAVAQIFSDSDATDGLRHRVVNTGQQEAHAVFHLSPLAPKPELGHVDTEPLPASGQAEPVPDVGGRP
jgi:hypothetical protein